MIPSRDPRWFPQGVYIHLPFCEAFCTYCDFSRELHSAGSSGRYLEALRTELALKNRELCGDDKLAPKTVFLGGGTPSALTDAELRRFFDILEENIDTSAVSEFTIEANPGSISARKLDLLLERRVNRISFGVQSFQPHLLRLLGRIHGADQGPEAVRLAKAAGFENISIDLMHGLPTQTLEHLRDDLACARQLDLQHVSAYGLIYEEGTPLTEAVEFGKVQRLEDEDEADHYRLVMKSLDAAGLPQYEISNYAKPGREAQHNLIYWRNESYLGAGVSAAHYAAGERSVNHRRMDAYMTAVENGADFVESREHLSSSRRARESLILELRLRSGVHPDEFSERWGLNLEVAFKDTLTHFRSNNLMEKTRQGRWRLTGTAMTVANGILREFL